MATGNKLEVGIGADITEFEKKIKEVEFDIKELSKLKLDKLKLGLDTTEINNNIKDAKKSLNELKGTVKDSGSAFSSMAPKVANGGNALMQFSRIAQDAPYGIMGIGNNLTATAEAFSYLQKETGSTGGALKALGSSLMGSGGILLGVSLLTTAFTLLSQSGLSVGDIVDKITGNFDDLGESFKKVSDEAKLSAAEQISSVKGLIAIAQDENQTKKRRLEIINDLQKQFPNYFGNLSTERIMYGNLTGVVNELTQALVNKAIAEKFSTVTAESTIKLWQANAKLVKGKEDLTKAELDYNNAAKDPDKSQSMQFYASAVDRANSRVKEARSEVLKFNAEVERGQNIINLASKKGAGVIAKPFSEKAPEKTFDTPQVKGLQSFITPIELTPIIDTSKISTSMKGIAQIIDENSLSALEAWNNFNIALSEIIETGTEQALIGFGEAIGNALANGGNAFKAGGNALIGIIGQMISSVGKELVKMGVLAQAYAAVITWMKKAFTNPYALAAAGVALVVIGSAISASASKVSSGGQGTNTSTGSTANNSSFSSGGFSGSSGNGGTVVFEIAGQKLIGVLSNTLNANKRLGGQLGLSNG